MKFVGNAVPAIPAALAPTNSDDLVDKAYVDAATLGPAFRASGTASIPSNAPLTSVKPNNVDFDTHTAYSTSTGRFTVPSGWGGIYSVHGHMMVTATAAGALEIYIYVNGSAIRGGSTRGFTTAASAVGADISQLVKLSAGDYVEIYYDCITTNSTTVPGSQFQGSFSAGWLRP